MTDLEPRARDMLRRFPLVDGHNDLPWALRERSGQAPADVNLAAPVTGTHTDLPRLAAGGVGAQFWSVYVPASLAGHSAVTTVLEQIDLARRMIARYPQATELALTARDVERIFASGRVASLLGAEGGHAIAGSLGVLRMLYALGVRYMTLTHNANVGWADSATDDPQAGGLTEFGRDVVREMQRIGMLVDLSHVSPDTMHDALETAAVPVIFSHSCARAVCDTPRNVPDDVLARLAQAADHIEHVRQVAGVEHVGIGGDFDGTQDVTVGLEDVSAYPALFAELLARGWSESDCAAVAGGNILRVLREAESFAARAVLPGPGPSASVIEPGALRAARLLVMSRMASADIQALVTEVAERAGRYLAALDERPVAPDGAALAGLARFDEPLPETAGEAAATLALLDEAGSPATVASAGGRYFGFVTGGCYPVALAAGWLATAWDQNAALPVMSPVAARLHEVVTGWLGELLGLPAGTAAVFVTGAAMANATALTAARDQQLARAGWDVQADGLFGAPELTVVVGDRAHATLIKALGLIGLGRERVRRVPADGQGRMRADCLPPDVAGPAVICLQAGEVNTGAFDPFPGLVDWARQRGAWVHVDGAFGLWALADPSRSELTTGLAEADSWATDGHKWLNVSYDCGIALVRRPGDLRRSFASVAGYLPPDAGFEAMHHTPQASQRARQVEVWAVLRTLGRQGVTDLIVRTCNHARAMAGHLRQAGLEVLNDVVLNQVLLRAATDDQTVAMVTAVQQDGTCWCGPTMWQQRPAMRISVSGWATTGEDIRQSADAIIAAAQRARR